jgi:hypothetical protein
MKTKYKIALAMLAGTRPPISEVRVMRLPRLTPLCVPKTSSVLIS